MLETLSNTFRVPELRRRLIITIILLCACRIGVYIPVPGVDLDALKALFDRLEAGAAAPIMNFVNIFSGGALTRCAVFGLGVMPYISASIIFQLLVQVIPTLKRISEEGEAGRRKINQYTRYATVFLCMIQAYMMLVSLRGMAAELGLHLLPATFGMGMYLLAALLITTGTLLLMWIGGEIGEYGIGKGGWLISMGDI